MPYKITDGCVTCGTCKHECPMEAISDTEDHLGYQIFETLCNDCGICVNICPVNAIIFQSNAEINNNIVVKNQSQPYMEK